MRIVILTLGTHGDVLPFVMLGKGLKERGHEVVISTAKNFTGLVASYDLNFEPVDADFQAMVNSEDGRKMIKNPLNARRNLRTWVYPMINNSLSTFYRLAKTADKILFHTKTLADCFADQFPGKMIAANVVPVVHPTAAFPNPAFSGLPIPQILNKRSFALTAIGLMVMKRPIQHFRKENQLPDNVVKQDIPAIYGISPAFLPVPDDYPSNVYYTGFWHLPSETQVAQHVTEFINAGEPPLLITFGSLYFETRLNLMKAFRRVISDLRIRLIVVRGWGLSDEHQIVNHPDMIVVDSVPYDKVLPHVKAVVHHGGIGTIAACLRAGKTFLPCPVLHPLGDQYFWSTVAYNQKLCLKPIPLKKMSEDRLVTEIQKLIAADELTANCKRMQQKLAAEDGIANAVKMIESF
ncbi:MAG: glycosyltransferase [Chitinophagaceae bacterium]|nr:MAG: glycosyltransferase [Chitinophagaceae bacterium]